MIRDREQRKIYLIQDGYLKKVALRFKQLDGHRLVNTPLDIHFKFEKAPEGYQASKHPQNQYQQLVGSIMWPAQMTRIEAILPAHLLSKYVCNPTEGHLAQVVRTLAYLTQHPNDGICLGCSPQFLVLEGFVDSLFGDDPDSRRSTCGYIFRLGEGPVSFKSGLQPLVTQSSTKAEYIAMALAAREAQVWAWIVNSSHLCFWEYLTQIKIGVSPPKNWEYLTWLPSSCGIGKVITTYLRCYLAEDCFQARDDSPHEDDCITLDNDLFRARWVLERVPRIRSRTL